MPNWVYNHLTLTGKREDIKAFAKKASQPIPVMKSDPDQPHSTIDGEWVVEDTEFSFWNFVAPAKEKWADYFTTSNGSAPRDNWYEWNNRNWNTKWDACSVEKEEVEHSEDSATFTVNFRTAWSPPSSVYDEIADQHPELEITIQWEEEQGFGEEIVSDGEGGLTIIDQWDIPESHADYVDREKEDLCTCSWNDDKEDWYDDCPGKTDDEVDDGHLRPITNLSFEKVS